VERFRSFLRAAGISEADEVVLVTRVNLSVGSVAYSDEMWKVLKAQRQSLRVSGHFGKYLDEDDFGNISFSGVSTPGLLEASRSGIYPHRHRHGATEGRFTHTFRTRE